MAFGFAKIWERNKGTTEELQVSTDAPASGPAEDDDFWAKVMERAHHDEEAKARNVDSGRGVRRKATKTVSFH